MSDEEGPAELFVVVDVQAFHVPPMSVMLAVNFSEATVDHPELKSNSVSEYTLMFMLWLALVCNVRV